MSKYDKWYIVGKLFLSSFRISLFNFVNLKEKITGFCYIVKMFAKAKKCPKNNNLYIFKKLLTMPFQMCNNFCKILNNIKNYMRKFLLTRCCLQIIFKHFFAKLVQSVSLCHRLSKKLIIIIIWQLKGG